MRSTRPRRRRRIVGPAVAVLLAFAALPAAAHGTVIGFDNLANGTVLGEQYAAQGVHFGPSPFPSISAAATVTQKLQARSVPNVAAFTYDEGTTRASTWMRFDKQQTHVSFYACNDGPAQSPNQVNILAYDSNGTQIFFPNPNVDCAANAPLPLITVAAPHITWINLAGNGSAFALDDLTFEANPPDQGPPPPPPLPPPPPPAKDFSLRFENPLDSRTIAVRPGRTTERRIVVDRNDSSFGPISMSIAGRKPPGVRVTFDPQTPSSSSDDVVTMRVTAEASTQPRYTPKVIIRGTPLGSTAGPVARNLAAGILVQGQLSVRTEGIEVTQGVQTNEQPLRDPYGGVQLVRGKKTVVRVFADFLGAAPPRVRGVPQRPAIGMALYGADRNGRALPGSPLIPDWSPDSNGFSVNDAGITDNERGDPAGAFVFVLPEAWTRDPISLTAKALAARPSRFAYELRPEPLAATVCVSFRCGADPIRGLGGISFRPQPVAKVLSALEVLYIPDGKLTGIPIPAARAFEKLLSLSPVPFVFLDSASRRTPWPTYRSVRFAPKGLITESTQAYDDATERLGDYVLGVFAWPPGAGYAPGPRVAVGDATELVGSGGAAQRPVTVIAHEMLHLLGLGHADSACGGGGGGFHDPTGRMRSVGLDTVTGSGGSFPGAPPYRVIPDTARSPGFDLMSYCSLSVGDPAHWISARNWNRLLGAGAPAGTHRARAAAGTGIPSLTVRARVDGTAVALASVTPLLFTPPPPVGDGPSPYTLVARDERGAVTASAPLARRTVPGALGGTPSVVTLEGSVPSTGVARVEIASNGVVLAARSRSAHAPTIAFVSPRPGARVNGGRPVTVRWRAADADGDALQVALEYSADAGRNFRLVAGGADPGRVTLAPGMLDASGRARLRLRVDDGFSTFATRPIAITVAPRAPAVTILDPVPGQRTQSGAALYLHGGAVDDQGRRVPGRRLRWFAGRRLLGHGETLSAAVAAGTRAIRLEAASRSGRIGRATVPIRVRSTSPFFLRLTAPARLSRRARAVRLTVASTQPARLRIGARRYAVGRSASRIVVPVRAGRGRLVLRLGLAAGGKQTVQYLIVARG